MKKALLKKIFMIYVVLTGIIGMLIASRFVLEYMIDSESLSEFIMLLFKPFIHICVLVWFVLPFQIYSAPILASGIIYLFIKLLMGSFGEIREEYALLKSSTEVVNARDKINFFGEAIFKNIFKYCLYLMSLMVSAIIFMQLYILLIYLFE